MFIFFTIILQLITEGSLLLTAKTKYDMFIFTQTWPPTSCYTWEEKSPSHHCNLPPNEEWSIHGLWPTKNGTVGPFFCNESLHFDLTALDSLRGELEVKWIDIHKEAEPHEFWRHEWDKHGTCSVDLECLSTERKYFKKGLDLLDEYDMKHVFGKANILPNQKYPLQAYLDGVRRVLGKNAYVECATNKKKKQAYILELRICFDKKFQLIDCDSIVHFPGNCNHNEDILYPSNVPDLFNNPLVTQLRHSRE